MKRYFLGLSIACASVVAQAEPSVPDAAWSQAWLDAAYQPRHAVLTQSADALMRSVDLVCAQTNAHNLEQARQTWLATSKAWRALDAAPAGPMVLERMGRKIDFRPTRPDDIEVAIQTGDVSNAATRGLPAIEYLLWGNAQPKVQLAKLKQPARCAYLSKTAQQVASHAHFLDQPWQTYRIELGAENPFFRENLLSEHINLLLSSMGSLQKRMPTADGVKPEQFAEWRSGSSHAQFMAQVGGMNLALQAVVQRLREEGSAQLADQVSVEMQQVQKRCESLPQNLAQSAAKARMACHQAITDLRARVQVQVGEKLDLTLGFTEGDGD
ncbi:imelysin family protein [uncultured Deefgea sp.]|uniref:imelysin family protein n=1 Tax=uncultured Deefgea sp. TaxID=1304914 RepID=UPI002592D06D|nr:imelysin family protein [uncultured Deefgea sp.]